MIEKEGLLMVVEAMRAKTPQKETDSMIAKLIREDFCRVTKMDDAGAKEYYRQHQDLSDLNERIEKGTEFCKANPDRADAAHKLTRLDEDRRILIGSINQMYEQVQTSMEAF